jgi:hypothetical protein
MLLHFCYTPPRRFLLQSRYTRTKTVMGYHATGLLLCYIAACYTAPPL